MQAAAKERWPVLMAIFCFDLVTYTIRVGAKAVAEGPEAVLPALFALAPQLLNMAVLYIAIHWINWRSRLAKSQIWAACQVCVCLLPAFCIDRFWHVCAPSVWSLLLIESTAIFQAWGWSCNGHSRIYPQRDPCMELMAI